MRKNVLNVAGVVALNGALIAASAGSAMAQVDQLLVLDGGKIVRYEYPNGTPIDHFVGQGATSLSNGWNMVYGPDGNLFVSCQNTAAVYRFNGQTGQYINTFIQSGAGGLTQPLGIAFQGNFFYVCSYNSDSVLQYNASTGNFVKNFILPGAGTLDGPQDIQFDTLGNAFVTSSLNDKVLKYNAITGAFISEILAPAGKSMNSPIGLLLDAQGNLFISCNGSDNILTIPSGGAIKELVAPFASGMNNPRDMCLSPEGWLLIGGVSTNKVLGFDRITGGFTGTFVFDNNDAGLGGGNSVIFVPQASSCYADCDGNGTLNIDDFICFQTFFVLGC